MHKHGKGTNKRLFALILNHHRIWGSILLPYILTKESNRTYYRLSECLSPFPNADTLTTLAPEEIETVRIINEYNDRNLYKIFSKEKNVKEFQEKVTSEKIEKFIRPYIERRINKALILSRDESIPVYYQKTKTGSLHYEDSLFLSGEKTVPIFRFDRNIDESSYNLSLETNGDKIQLFNKNIEILCINPCVIRESQSILFVSDIEGSKLKPFLKKEKIVIPKKTESRYFKSFVLNTINTFQVEGNGFEIKECVPEKAAIVELDQGLKGTPHLVLTYDYQGFEVYSNDSTPGFTVFEDKGDNFLYKKYYRDYTWEKSCRDFLGELGFFSEDEICFSPLSSEKQKDKELYLLIENVNRNWNELRDSGFIVKSNLSTLYNLQPISLEISSALENDWFDISANVMIGDYKIPFSALRKNILNGIREYILPDASVAVLPETWFSRYKSVFEFGKITDKTLQVHKQHFSFIADALQDEERHGLEKLKKLLSPDQIPVINPPEGLNCKMRDYQAEGLNWLNYLQSSGLGGCLADDMGLGKTIQTLAILQHNKENYVPGVIEEKIPAHSLFDFSESRQTSLIIVPASLVYNWENEIRRFLPGMRVCSYKGNNRIKGTSYFSSYDIILSSYHTIRQDIDILSQFSFHYIILDESQLIKNPASMLYKTVIRLISDHKLVLTGTPIENSLTDLWTQLNFVNPGLLGELSFFHREYARPIEKMKDEEKELKLRKIIQPFILRRTKEMVAKDLPSITEQTIYCDMTDEQFKVYDEEKSLVRNSILKNIESNGTEKSAILVLQGLMKLRLISNHPVLTNEEYEYGSGKFENVIQDMISVIAEGHKILVFSSFVKHLNLYSEELCKMRIPFSYLTGASTNREKIVSDFQNDASINIFLISLKAGGVGLNLTAADYVFILDPWWNPAAEIQALNRAHRIGQEKPVFVYRYLSSGSIEEKIVRLQERKSNLADAFIYSSNPLKEIKIEQILDIIN